LGRSRKDPYSPTEEISAVLRGRGEKIVSDNSKCIRTSEWGRGVNFLFPLWGWYGCFLEWPITLKYVHLLLLLNMKFPENILAGVLTAGPGAKITRVCTALLNMLQQYLFLRCYFLFICCLIVYNLLYSMHKLLKLWHTVGIFLGFNTL
jgi:hypothetical protein